MAETHNHSEKMDEISTGPKPESKPLTENQVVPSVLGPSTFYDSGLGASVSEQAFHQAYMSPGASHSSFVSSIVDEDPKAARVPQMPVEVGIGKPFRCGYCGNILGNIKNRQDWK